MAKIDQKVVQKRPSDIIRARIRSILTQEEYDQVKFTERTDGRLSYKAPEEVMEKLDEGLNH